jgi:hypothetical protein
LCKFIGWQSLTLTNPRKQPKDQGKIKKEEKKEKKERITGRKNEERSTEKQTSKEKHVLYIFTVTLYLQWFQLSLRPCQYFRGIKNFTDKPFGPSQRSLSDPQSS